MMHDKFGPVPGNVEAPQGAARLVHEVRQRKWLLFVVLPTLLLALYYWALAANQYESEAHILVRSASGGQTAPAGISQALSMFGGGGGGGAGASDASSIADYLSSHDAVDALRAHSNLVATYRRPEADLFSRLMPADPTPERLLNYYRGHVSVKLDPDSGITNIRVRTFRPDDSLRLINDLLRLGEARVNVLNRRAYDSSLRLARLQLAEAETALSNAQNAMTGFRQGRRIIDPVATGQAQINVVSGLQTSLAQARAQRAAMAGAILPSSPQARAVDARVRALEGQLAIEQAKLAGGGNAIAAKVGDYQGLLLRQQFASKRYDDAAASLQHAREQAIRQQLFVVRVVEPNLPVKALYPKSLRVVGTVFVVLTLCYALVWLILAGVREHTS